MKNFTVNQINQAYQDVDQRVLTAMQKINIDRVLVTLRQEYNFALDKLDMLRTSIDFVLIGLMSARELSQEVSQMFPEHKDTIITQLNESIFKPVLEYVRSHQPVFLDTSSQESIQTSSSEEPNEVFSQSEIEILDEEGTSNSTKASSLTIPVKPGFDPSTTTQNKLTPNQSDPYQEEII